MVGEGSFPIEQPSQRTPYVMERYGNVPDDLVNRNAYIAQSLESHLSGGRVMDMLVAVPPVTAKPIVGRFWSKRPPQSITFIALAASPAEDHFAETVPQKARNERHSLQTAIAVQHQISQSGGFRKELLEYRTDDGEDKSTRILKVRKIKHKINDDLWVPVFIVDTKTMGETGRDQMVLASFWQPEDAQKEVSTLKSDLSQAMGEPREVAQAVLNAFATEGRARGSKYSSHIHRVLGALGRKRAGN